MNNCERYRSMISLMLDGELPESQKTELEAHIAVCGECARIYDAFAFISSSIEDGLSDPPESLRDGVMKGVRAQRGHTPAEKKLSRVWVRLAALAACLALVVFAAAKSGDFFQGAASSSQADGQTLECAAAPASAGTSNVTDEVAGTADNGTALQGAAEDSDSTLRYAAYADATASPFEDGENEIIVASEDGENGESLRQAASDEKAADNAAVSLMGISSIAVFSGDAAEPDPEPITTVTDEQTITAIMDLLAFSEAGEDIQVSGAPIFIFKVVADDDSSYNLSVWIVDGRLCCVSDADGVLYVAAGDAGDVFDFIAAA